jgi:hypothetical protein
MVVTEYKLYKGVRDVNTREYALVLSARLVAEIREECC